MGTLILVDTLVDPGGQSVYPSHHETCLLFPHSQVIDEYGTQPDVQNLLCFAAFCFVLFSAGGIECFPGLISRDSICVCKWDVVAWNLVRNGWVKEKISQLDQGRDVFICVSSPFISGKLNPWPRLMSQTYIIRLLLWVVFFFEQWFFSFLSRLVFSSSI